MNNDAWSGGHGPQTIYVCNESSWYVTTNQPNNGGQVETYPDTEYDVNGRTGTSEPVGSFTNITSTFAETFPSAGGWDAGYDLWSNYWSTEVMIWNQWSGTNSYWPSLATITATLGGVGYKFYDNGTKGTPHGELMFFRDIQVKSGSVNILDAFKWLVANGYMKATSEPTQLEYGVEVSYTSGTETFPMTGLTMTVNGTTTTSPTTTTAPPASTTTAAPPASTTTSTPTTKTTTTTATTSTTSTTSTTAPSATTTVPTTTTEPRTTTTTGGKRHHHHHHD